MWGGVGWGGVGWGGFFTPFAIERGRQEGGSFLCGRRVASGGMLDEGPTRWSGLCEGEGNSRMYEGEQ